MSDTIVGKSVRIRLKGELHPSYQQAWNDGFGKARHNEVDFVPAICGVVKTIDKSLNVLLETPHIGAICVQKENEEGKAIALKTQTLSFRSMYIRGCNIRFIEIEE